MWRRHAGQEMPLTPNCGRRLKAVSLCVLMEASGHQVTDQGSL
jgi:hypothetical protein